MPMDPVTASLLVGGLGAGMPYLFEGGRRAMDSMGGEIGNVPNLSGMFEAEEAASLPYEQFLSEEIERLIQAGGSSTGRAIAASGKSGLGGMNPAMAAQARQGEIQGAKAAGGLREQQALLPMQKFAEQQQRSRQDIQAILANYDLPGERSRRLGAMAQAYGDRPQAGLYKAAM